MLLASFSGCAQAPEYVAYEAHAITGWGIPGTPNPEPLVPDASSRFPPIVSKCGGTNVRETPATDGVTIFRIDVPKADEARIVDCLTKQLPGVQSFHKAQPE